MEHWIIGCLMGAMRLGQVWSLGILDRGVSKQFQNELDKAKLYQDFIISQTTSLILDGLKITRIWRYIE